MGTTEAAKKAAPVRKRTPRQQTKKAAEPAKPSAQDQAWAAFEQRAQEWLLEQSGREVNFPDDLAQVVKLGVPCRGCGVHVHRIREEAHTVRWQRKPGRHWAAGISVECRRFPS